LDDIANQLPDFDDRANDYVVVESRGGEIVAALSIEDQPFESQVLSRSTVRIHRFWQKARNEPLAGSFIRRSVDFLAGQGIELFAYRVPEWDVQGVDRFKAAGFKVIETLQTFECKLHETALELPPDVDFACPADGDECARIAEKIFHSDRFHADPEISNNAANELKKAWIQNSVSGRADKVLITRSGSGAITGFNACMLNEKTAAIDLIGVGTEYQGQGLGRLLVQAAQKHYAGRAKSLTVGTQLNNSHSIALYQSLGFTLLASSLTLHLHRHEGLSGNE